MELSFGELAALFGGATAIATGIAAWIGRLGTERMLSQWRRDESTLLETLRATNAQSTLLLQAGIRSFGSGHDSTLPKRVSAAEELWGQVLHLRDRFSSSLFFFTILQPDEYSAAAQGHAFPHSAVGGISEDLISQVLSETAAIEAKRPLLGETLWLRFYIYRAFLGRLTLLIIHGREGRSMSDWRKDDGLHQHLKAVLPASELQAILQGDFAPAALNRAINALEGLILAEISKILSGQRSAAESFANARALQNLVAEQPPGGSAKALR